MAEVVAPDVRFRDKPGAWVDLGLTLPVFLVYHLGVVFLGVKNATDFVTSWLLRACEGNVPMYLGATLVIGGVFAAAFAVAGRGQAFHPRKFIQIGVEGVIYAISMAVISSYVVGHVFAGPSAIATSGPFVGLVMSMGAGFYEELTFRAILFGLGAKVLVWLLSKEKMMLAGQAGPAPGMTLRSMVVMVTWALVCAVVFSGVHYVGSLSDAFEIRSFTFRMLLGLALTLIFVTRGFAAAVWTHALYDVWVMVFHR
ncbi:MAG: CPBP family intramembrane metalloprotease [Myxococcales bacterium]|nr:CPBP family intramembrane metalloprotease [Myxococcales bacterium]